MEKESVCDIEVTFNFSRWKACVITLLRLVQVSPSNEDNPNARSFMKGLRGGFTTFLCVIINLVSSAFAIMSLGFLPNQHNEISPTRI